MQQPVSHCSFSFHFLSITADSVPWPLTPRRLQEVTRTLLPESFEVKRCRIMTIMEWDVRVMIQMFTFSLQRTRSSQIHPLCNALLKPTWNRRIKWNTFRLRSGFYSEPVDWTLNDCHEFGSVYSSWKFFCFESYYWIDAFCFYFMDHLTLDQHVVFNVL